MVERKRFCCTSCTCGQACIQLLHDYDYLNRLVQTKQKFSYIHTSMTMRKRTSQKCFFYIVLQRYLHSTPNKILKNLRINMRQRAYIVLFLMRREHMHPASIFIALWWFCAATQNASSSIYPNFLTVNNADQPAPFCNMDSKYLLTTTTTITCHFFTASRLTFWPKTWPTIRRNQSFGYNPEVAESCKYMNLICLSTSSAGFTDIKRKKGVLILLFFLLWAKVQSKVMHFNSAICNV